MLTDGDGQGTTEGNPSIVDGQRKTADAEQTVLSVKLVAMARGIDNFALLGNDRSPPVCRVVKHARSQRLFLAIAINMHWLLERSRALHDGVSFLDQMAGYSLYESNSKK